MSLVRGTNTNFLLAPLAASFYIPILKMAPPPMIAVVSWVRLVNIAPKILAAHYSGYVPGQAPLVSYWLLVAPVTMNVWTRPW